MKIVLFFVSLVLCVGNVAAREQIKIVGSSVVFPFSHALAEELKHISRYLTAAIDATGTDTGIKLFCQDNGLNSPDIVNTNRRMTTQEFDLCERNGVDNITKVLFGYDAVVLAQSLKAKPLKITHKMLFLAVAKRVPNKENNALIENPYQYWDQINAGLSHRKILIFGPAEGSSLRATLEEVVLQRQSAKMSVYQNEDKKALRAIRSDGAYMPGRVNSQFILQKLSDNIDAIGVFNHGFFVNNTDRFSHIKIDGLDPSPENISRKKYPFWNSLFFYIKNDHLQEIPALREYMEMFCSVDVIGQDGLLSEQGFIPLPEQEIKEACAIP